MKTCPVCGTSIVGARISKIYCSRECKNTAYTADHSEEISIRMKARREALRDEIIKVYGGRCVCCGEETPEFLSVDHINGGGSKHRRQLKSEGQEFYRWLKKQGFPKEEYQLLCQNCNSAKGHYGICPHQLNKQEEK